MACFQVKHRKSGGFSLSQRGVHAVSLLFMMMFFVVTGGVINGTLAVHAAEMKIENNKIFLGEDYSVFANKTGSPALCRKKCAGDRRCQAWTYVRPSADGIGECRLKRAAVSGFKNGCCISGVKQEDFRAKQDGPRGANKNRRAAVKYCDQFAERAAELNQKNVTNRCGYRGRAWHSNVDRHFNRCMRIGRKQRQTEIQGQRVAVKSCIEELNSAKRIVCDHYARTSVLQNASRSKGVCAVNKDGQWSKNFKRHYEWCLGVPKKQVRAVQASREAELQQCFALEGKRSGVCHDYAEDAIAHFQKNIQKGCDLHGPRWHNNYRRHVGWCRQASAKQRFREIKSRKLTLKTCRLFGKIGIKWR